MNSNLQNNKKNPRDLRFWPIWSNMDRVYPPTWNHWKNRLTVWGNAFRHWRVGSTALWTPRKGERNEVSPRITPADCLKNISRPRHKERGSRQFQMVSQLRKCNWQSEKWLRIQWPEFSGQSCRKERAVQSSRDLKSIFKSSAGYWSLPTCEEKAWSWGKNHPKKQKEPLPTFALR